MSTPDDAWSDTDAPRLELAFQVRARVAPPLELGTAGGVTRRQVPILDGTVSGPRLRGRVLPGGADWQRIHASGVTEILARYVIETHDGALISVENPGIRRAPPEVMRRLLAGEVVDPSLVYFRTTPRFDTASPRYAWLAQSVFICCGVRKPAAVSLGFFVVS